MIHIRKRVVWLMIAAPAAVFSAPPVQVTIQPTSSITLKGTSTLHDFECSSKSIEGTIEIDPAKQSFTSAEVVIPVKSIHSDNTSMDDKMYDALKIDEYPAIHFSLTVSDSMQILRTAAADTGVHLRGNLTIAGRQRPIELRVNAVKRDGDIINIRGTEKLLMTDYGIDPPTFMLGVLKTGNEVTIEFSLDLKEDNSQPRAAQSR